MTVLQFADLPGGFITVHRRHLTVHQNHDVLCLAIVSHGVPSVGNGI